MKMSLSVIGFWLSIYCNGLEYLFPFKKFTWYICTYRVSDRVTWEVSSCEKVNFILGCHHLPFWKNRFQINRKFSTHMYQPTQSHTSLTKCLHSVSRSDVARQLKIDTEHKTNQSTRTFVNI